VRRALVAAGLSLLAPGAGQLYLGARRRAAVLLAVWGGLCAAALALVVARPTELVLSKLGPGLLAAALLANGAVLGFRIFAIADAWRRASGAAAVALAALVALAAAPHVAAGYVFVRGYDVLDSVFAGEEPRDVLGARGLFVAFPPVGRAPQDLDPPAQRPLRALPDAVPTPFSGPEQRLADAARIVAAEQATFDYPPWVTILLLGSDRGPRQAGHRTDTMIVAAIQRETGRAVLFGIPRNLVGVPVNARWRFHEPLNALYRFAHTRPGLFRGGRDPGATALKRALTRLLGVRITYYALVDLDGFVDVIDALGGVRIHVKERIVDEVTRPAWRETKPRIDVFPGRTYRFTGRTALAYVRSRKASSDYRRMARQRCFLSALAQQLDVTSVLTHFGSVADAIESSVRTDVPLSRAPDLARLARSVDPKQTLTETFGPVYFAGRRFDGWPYPNVAKIQAAVRDAILHPELAPKRRIETVNQSC
jgi:LCP family protein required for cell wall assembly